MRTLTEGFRTRIKQNKPVCTNQVDTTSSSLTAEEEDKFWSVWIIELIYELLALVHGHSTIKSKTPVTSEKKLSYV